MVEVKIRPGEPEGREIVGYDTRFAEKIRPSDHGLAIWVDSRPVWPEQWRELSKRLGRTRHKTMNGCLGVEKNANNLVIHDELGRTRRYRMPKHGP